MNDRNKGYVVVGKTSFHIAEMSKMNKTDFRKHCTGKIDCDVDEAYNAIQVAAKEAKSEEAEAPKEEATDGQD